MEIEQLPQPYKRLAELRTRQCLDFDSSLRDVYKFWFFKTPEGFEFWHSVKYAKTKDELPFVKKRVVITFFRGFATFNLIQ